MNTCKTKQPIIPWPGGKRRLAKEIVPRIPPHRCWVEVFGGAAAITMAKPRMPGSIEVYNDRSEDLVNLFRQAKFHPEGLCRELEFLPSSRAEFAVWRSRLGSVGMTEIQRAALFLRMAMMSFGGLGGHFGTSKFAGGAAFTRVAPRMDLVRAFAERFDGVAIEHMDWRALIAQYDGPETVFFCDPPYLGAPCGRYAGWSVEEVRELAATLSRIRGNWMVTLNDHPDCREAFAGHDVLPLQRANGIGNRSAAIGRVYHEILILRGSRGDAARATRGARDG